VAAAGWVAAATFAIVAGWALGVLLEREPPTPLQWPLVLGESIVPTSWKAPPGVDFALSPDGSKLAYVGPTDEGWQLWYQDLEDEEDEPLSLSLPHSAYNPVFSPEGDFLAYETDRGIYTVSVSAEGRTPVPSVQASLGRTSADPSGVPRMPAWGENGWIYFALDGIIHRIPARGGGVAAADGSEAFTDSTEDGRQLHPSALPDDRGLLVTIARDPAERSTIGVAGRKGGRVDDLQVRGAMARYATSGHLVYTTLDGALWAVPFDQDGLEVRGEARPIADPVDVKADLASQFALSRSGHLIYRSGPFLPVDQSLVRVTPAGTMEPVDSTWLGRFENLDMSPDQNRVAVTVGGPGGAAHIWVKELGGGPPVQLTQRPSRNEDPEWSSDGRWITFLSNRLGEGDVWRVRADGTGEAELVYDGPRPIANHAWSPDDVWLVYADDSPELDDGIRIVRPGSGMAPRAVAVTEGREVGPMVSPDGRWIAWGGVDETGQYCVHVARFPDPGAERWSWLSTREGVPVWSQDGRRLFFWRHTDPSDTRSVAELVAVELDPEMGLFQENPVPVLQGISSENVHIFYDLTDDDSTFLMVRKGDLNGQVIFWQHFAERLKEQGSG
jgi:Tol biopolymer transport system component